MVQQPTQPKPQPGRLRLTTSGIVVLAAAGVLAVFCGIASVAAVVTSDPSDSGAGTTAPAAAPASRSPSPAPSPSPTPTPSPSRGAPATTEPATPAQERTTPAREEVREASDCDAYRDSGSWCRDGVSDYDCEGGSGNGPGYAPRGVELVDPDHDPFGLDRDGDGEGCEGRAPAPPPEPEPEPDPGTDPRFGTCGEAIDAGYGPYYRGQDPEYDWYRDADSDGIVCER